MFELPLFPLNTVLFPGMPLPLHIFEDRYKQMINNCLEEKEPFGVVLIRNGKEALGPLAQPHSIGCTARIVEVQKLSDGRMNINSVGERRFRIISLNYDAPYLIGNVEYYPLGEGDPEQLLKVAGSLVPKVKQYMHILNEVEEIDLDPEHLPGDPLILAHLSAVLLQIPAEKKQELLTSASALDLLNNTNQIYRREIAFMRAMVDRFNDQSQKAINLN
jgi:Lon protease-like protein